MYMDARTEMHGVGLDGLALEEVVALYEITEKLELGLSLEHSMREAALGAMSLVDAGGARIVVYVDGERGERDEVVVGRFDPTAHDGIVGFDLEIQGQSTGRLEVFMPGSDRRAGLGLLARRAANAIEKARMFWRMGQAFRETVEAFNAALEAKDHYTKGHSDRVRVYAKLLARGLGLPEHQVARIELAASLHDIGKLSVHTRALRKESALDEGELDELLAHPQEGAGFLARVDLLRDLVPDVLHHHERWDGTGYPDGLAGEAIPLGARIISIADAYDAMTTDRPYRKALAHDEARHRLAAGAGTQFDPTLVEAFLDAIESFRAACREAGQWYPK